MGKFDNSYTDDPFTILLDIVIEDAQELALNTSILPPERKAFQELKTFKYFYDSVQGDRPFAYAVSLFPTLTVTLEAVITHLEKAAVSNRKTVKPNPDLETVKYLRKDFEELKSLAASLTPAHIALEAHFFGWVASPAYSQIDVDERVYEFFEPLRILRDDYVSFSEPKMLVEYLATVERLASDPFYSEFMNSKRSRFAVDRKAEVARLLVELEIFALMSEL